MSQRVSKLSYDRVFYFFLSRAGGAEPVPFVLASITSLQCRKGFLLQYGLHSSLTHTAWYYNGAVG